MEKNDIREVELKEYLRVICKRRRQIVLITTIVTIMAVVVSLAIPKVYETKACVLIEQPAQLPYKIDNMDMNTYNHLEITLPFRDITMDVDACKHLAMLPSFLVSVIKKMNLKDEDSGEELSSDSFAKMLNAGVAIRKVQEDSLNSELLFLSVRGSEPVTIKDIANTWAELLIEEFRKIKVNRLAGIRKVVYEQYDIINKKLLKAKTKLGNFEKNAQLESKKNELEIKRELLANYKKELPVLEMQFKKNQLKLNSLKKQLKKQTAISDISKIPNKNLLQKTILENKDLSKHKNPEQKMEVNPSMFSMNSINNAEMELEILTGNIDFYKEAIPQIEKEITAIKKYVVNKTMEKESLSNDVTVLQKLFDTLSQKVEQAKIAEIESNSNIKIVSKAIEPEIPVGPRRKLIVFVGGIIGLVLSFFIAFFLEYIEKIGGIKAITE